MIQKSNLFKLLNKLGLNPSQAIKLFAMAVINSGSIPFKLIAKQPNQETIKAIQKLESGSGIKVGGVKALFKELDVEM